MIWKSPIVFWENHFLLTHKERNSAEDSSLCHLWPCLLTFIADFSGFPLGDKIVIWRFLIVVRESWKGRLDFKIITTSAGTERIISCKLQLLLWRHNKPVWEEEEAINYYIKIHMTKKWRRKRRFNQIASFYESWKSAASRQSGKPWTSE